MLELLSYSLKDSTNIQNSLFWLFIVCLCNFYLPRAYKNTDTHMRINDFKSSKATWFILSDVISRYLKSTCKLLHSFASIFYQRRMWMLELFQKSCEKSSYISFYLPPKSRAAFQSSTIYIMFLLIFDSYHILYCILKQ